MGSSIDVMRTFIAREISANFSQNDGWAVAKTRPFSGYNEALSIERFYNGANETVTMGVCMENAVPAEFIDFIKASAPATGKCGVLVAKNADISAVPKTWKVLTMQAFGYEDEKLVWYRNPARKPRPVAQKPAAA